MISFNKAQNLFTISILVILLMLGGCGDFTQNSKEPDTVYSCVLAKDAIEIYLGMPVSELSEVLNSLIEDNWVTTLPQQSLTVICVDGVLCQASIDNEKWAVNRNMLVGISLDEVKETLGDKYEERDLDANAMVSVIEYYYDASGELAENSAQYDYSIQMNSMYKDGADKKTVVNLIAGKDFSTDSIIGASYFMEQGVGSASFPVPRIDANFASVDVIYDGEEDFVISQNGTELFRRSGKYDGRVHLPAIGKGNLEISADGDWSIIARYFYDEKGAALVTGTGDFITGYYSPESSPQKWRVIHEGDGRFIINQFHWSNGKISENAVDISGSYSADMECIFEGYSVALEILTEGNWIIELVE